MSTTPSTNRFPATPSAGRSISRDLTVSLLLLLAFVTVGTSIAVYRQASNQARTELGRLADDHVQELTDILSGPLWALDVDQVRRMGSIYSRDGDIALLRVVDETGHTVFESVKDLPPSPDFTRRGDILHDGDVIGHVELTLSTLKSRRTVDRLVRTTMIALALAMGVILTATGILLRLFLRQPLDVLQAGVERIAEGEFDHSFDISQAELRGIARQFERMSTKVRAREIELKILNESLRVEVAERHRAQQALGESEHKFRRLVENLPGQYFFYIRRVDGEVTYLSPSIRSALGFSPDAPELRDHFLARLTAGSNGRIVAERLRLGAEGHRQPAFETEIRHRDGSIRTLELLEYPVFDSEGAVSTVEGIAHDITIRKQRERALQRAESKYRNIFERASEGIYQTSADGRFVNANPAMARILGYDSPLELIHSVRDVSRQLYAAPADRERMMRTLEQDGEVVDFQARAVRRDGRTIWMEMNARAVRDGDGNIEYVEGILSDITMRKDQEAALERKATMDEVTGVPNRFLFNDRLEQAFLRNARTGDPFALLYIDLDDFKAVNDTFGHHAGDVVLREVAQRIRERIRQSDTLARIGGDEFCVILSKLSAPRDAEIVADAVASALRSAVIVQGRELTIEASVGVGVCPRDGASPEELMRAADEDMYRAKRERKNLERNALGQGNLKIH